jgi:hypothetical protein
MVFICSPYAGDIEHNTIKAKEYCRYAAMIHDEIPFAPHLLFTQFLDEFLPEEREQGISMGLDVLTYCSELWIFGNYVSKGMERELELARSLNKKIRWFDDDCKEL